MELAQVMRTTANTRELKADPVLTGIIYRVLDSARFAPSGRNLQGWRVIVVTDPGIRTRLRDLYSTAWYSYVAPLRTPPGQEPEREPYADNLDQVPVHLVILVETAKISTTIEPMDTHLVNPGSSIYPFVQNVLLGLRAEGLGAAFTTAMIAVEDEVLKTLRVPDGYLLAGHIGVGWPVKKLPSKLARNSVEHFATEDTFDGPPLSA